MAPKKSKIQSGTRGGKQLGMKDMFKRIVVNIAIPDPGTKTCGIRASDISPRSPSKVHAEINHCTNDP